MKNVESWKPSLFEVNCGSLKVNRQNVSPSSWLACELTAQTFSRVLPTFCDGKLLDLGCGQAPYYELYSRYVDSVTCMDWANSFHENPHLDFIQDLNKPLSLKCETFDTVLLSDVLEHVAETNSLLKEINRVLKPGGRLIISVPFLYHLHEIPYDNYRFTSYGLTHKLDKFGFEIDEFVVHGSWGVVLIDHLSKGINRIRFFGQPVVRILQWGAIWYFTKVRKSSQPHSKKNAFPLSYVCVASKRSAIETS